MAQSSRRHFMRSGLALAGLGLLSGCGVPLPWQPAKVPRIGYLTLRSIGTRGFELFRDGLRDLGYVEGRTILIETRWAESTEQLPVLAAELVALPVDLILAAGTPPVKAAMDATRTIPIVFPVIGDPVGSGFVENLARPGGNVTGLSDLSTELQQKRLELLRDMVPGLTRVMLLEDMTISEVNGNLGGQQIQAGAQMLGLQLLTPTIRTAQDLSPAFQMATSQKAEALLVSDSPLITMSGAVGPQIVEFARAARLPLIAKNPPFPVAGGLSSYGPAGGTDPLNRGAATIVDRILKGARPADLPVVRPAQFDFVINQKTAQAIGLTIPDAVLQQATQVIQ